MSNPRRIFITGAAGGLGQALARHYASEPGNVVLGLAGRNEPALRALKQSLGVEAAYYIADVRNLNDMHETANDFQSSYGTPDVVIANAGISHGTSAEIAEDAAVFKLIMDTNMLGAMHTFQSFISTMKARGSGCLAAISSVAGLRGLPGAGAYSASKAALNTYMEALRVDLHGSGVKSIAVCPGHIKTQMTDGNEFLMPFIMSAEAAAAKIAWHIEHSYGCIVTPWQMRFLSVALKHAPNFLFDRGFRSMPTKKRLITSSKTRGESVEWITRAVKAKTPSEDYADSPYFAYSDDGVSDLTPAPIIAEGRILSEDLPFLRRKK